MNIRTLTVLFVLFQTACLPRMDGCPWTDLSEVTVTPFTDCLDVVLLPQEDSDGGCVDPTLVVTNDCDETLTIPGDVTTTGNTVEIVAGDIIEVLVSLEAATEEQNSLHWKFEANLGEQVITIAFEGTGGDADE